jgi:hypothetical protein
MKGTRRIYTKAAINEMVKFARNPVFTAPSFPLAVNLNAQKGSTPAIKVKYGTTSLLTLDHIPYTSDTLSGGLMAPMARIIIS